MRRRFSLLLIVAGMASVADADASCDSPEHAQFDFLLGTWEILNANGELVGTNLVSRRMGGCVIHEEFQSVGGRLGESFSMFDAADRAWTQTWVDNRGTRLQLVGAYTEATGMRLASRRGDSAERFQWRALGDGRVRQSWEQRAAAGGEWTERFVAEWRRIDRRGTGGESGLSEGLGALAGLLGSWQVTPEQRGDEGGWRRLPSIPAEFAADLNGHAIVARSSMKLPVGWVFAIETFSYDAFQKRYRFTWHDSLAGLMDVYEGAIVDGVLAMDNVASGTYWTLPDGEQIAFRLEYELSASNGIRRARVLQSYDGGETWELFQKNEYRRLSD